MIYLQVVYSVAKTLGIETFHPFPLKANVAQSSRHFIKYWLPVILWMCFVYWMSTEGFSSQHTFSLVTAVLRFLFPRISPHEVRLIHLMIRKVAHVIEYFILGLILFRAFHGGSTASWKWRWSLFAVIGVVVWAVSDEWHQSFVSTRMASVVDVGMDTAGGILAQCVGALWHRYTRK